MGRLKKLLSRGIEMFQQNNMSVYSGYATLFIVISLFPFIILIIAVVNMLPWDSAEDVADILFKIMPILKSVKGLIETILTDLRDQSSGLLASAAAVTALWSASKGIFAIQKGLNQLDHRAKERGTEKPDTAEIAAKGKGYIKNVVRRLLFTLMLVILIPALLVMEIVSATYFRVSMLLIILFAFLVILLVYAMLPAKHRTFKSQLPGTFLTCICWFAFSELFAFFIPRIYRASNLYGSLASVFLVLLWLRYIVMILFAGGVLNRTLEEIREQ